MLARCVGVDIFLCFRVGFEREGNDCAKAGADVTKCWTI